ncbi:hypothetical protein HY857_00500 [Candidatus Saccharibacteria bacterium]|nr:hypothetical protein [Candidatus Saccharibacteria bacterium]
MDAAAKQQVVERVKQANKILVTVSTNPSVDQLAACVGLTLLLNRMNKHATAVFSGKIPSTLEFLKPEKTIETNTDSLRDFIISLDKAKADKLRYKVEDQVVRIFITPYRTSLSEKDLVFSQGDFNVEAVMALGVADRNQIDAAITAHGRILHDATVISINAGQGNAPNIGQINWKDPAASSLSEMLVSISESFGSGLIDNQTATAFLTGIVAETERFRNPKTTSKVMTMAAQLMAAGANQQLIAKELETPPPPPPPPPPHTATPTTPKPPEPPKKPEGILNVSHEPAKPDSPEVDINPSEIHIDEEGNLKTNDDLKAEVDSLKNERDKQKSDIDLESAPPPPPPPVAQTPPPAYTPPLPPPPPPVERDPRIAPDPTVIKPLDPSTLPLPGAHTLLDPTNHQPSMSTAFTADTEPDWQDPYNSAPADALGNSADVAGAFGHSATIQPPGSSQQSPLTPGVDSARSAVDNALASTPFDPSFAPPVSSLNAQPLGADIHAPGQPSPAVPPTNETPSLPLPGADMPGPASQAGSMRVDPPPVPPPFPLTSNPGAVIPDAPKPPPQQP